jgi:hypothetical protein
VDRLTRRPLRTLEGIAEPYAEDPLSKRLRRMKYRLTRHTRPRSAENRRQRDNYHQRMPQKQDGRRNNANRKIGPKRKSVDKRRGAGFLRGRAGGMR